MQVGEHSLVVPDRISSRLLLASTLLQQIFRHKMVHQAMTSVVEFDGKTVGWRYIHQSPKRSHLKLVRLKRYQQFEVTDFFSVFYNYRFTIGIANLMQDICGSILPVGDGLLARIADHAHLQSNFEKALIDMYNPWNHNQRLH